MLVFSCQHRKRKRDKNNVGVVFGTSLLIILQETHATRFLTYYFNPSRTEAFVLTKKPSKLPFLLQIVKQN